MNTPHFIPKHLILAALLAAIVISYRPAQARPFQLVNAEIIIDQSGRRIHVRKPFERIISLYGAHTENLFALGLDHKIIGVTPNEVYPPEAKSKPVFSYHDDPEKFLVAHPDLVLIRPMIDRAYAQLIARLGKSGITVLSLQPGNLHEMFTYWKILGILTGTENRANQMIRHFQTAARDFKSLSQPIQNKKRVYFEAIHSRMKTFIPRAMAIFALECAGGINIAPDAESSRGTNIGIYGKERICPTLIKSMSIWHSSV
jgi:iron complex transport system substrate-binding protein